MSTIAWKRTADETPVDDSQVLAVVTCLDGKRDIRDCEFQRYGPDAKEIMFIDPYLDEFGFDEVEYWIYKTDLAATVPSGAGK